MMIAENIPHEARASPCTSSGNTQHSISNVSPGSISGDAPPRKERQECQVDLTKSRNQLHQEKLPSPTSSMDRGATPIHLGVAHDKNKRKNGASTPGKFCIAHNDTARAPPAVRYLKWVLAAVLVASAVAVAAMVYHYTSAREHEDFQSQFDSDANKLHADIATKFDLTMGALDAFMFRVVSQAKFTNNIWPFVTIPDLPVQAAKLLSQADAIYMAFYPLITKEQRPAWENFTQDNDEWVEESLRVQANNPRYHGPNTQNFVKSCSIWRNDGPIPQDDQGPFLPSWLGSPVVPNDKYPPYNWNGLAYHAFGDGLVHCMNTKSVIATAVSNYADPNDPQAVAQAAVTSDWAVPYMPVDAQLDSNEPCMDMYYPVVNNIEDVVIDTSPNTTEPALGAVAFSIYWAHLLRNILPPQSQGLIILFYNPCGDQHFTYQIDGKQTTFLGFQDLHSTRFDHMAKSSTLAQLLTSRHGSSYKYTGLPMNSDFCPYTLTVYPSEGTEAKFITMAPWILSLGAAFIFIFVAALFLLYDALVRRAFNAKQKLLEAKRHFMRFISHEVRTPLNSVYLGLSVLQDEISQAVVREQLQMEHNAATTTTKNGGGGSNSSPPTDRSFSCDHDDSQLQAWLNLTQEISDSAQASVDVLNDLLNYDKISKGKMAMEFTVFNVWRLVEETSNGFRLSARKKHVQVTMDNKLLLQANVYGGKNANDFDDVDAENGGNPLNTFMVVGDRIRLAQVLRNLMSNAIKFTPAGGNLRIRTFWHPILDAVRSNKMDKYTLKSGKELAFGRRGTFFIQIIDTGVGLSEKQLTEVFHDGTQFNVENQAGQGSGLGLFISKGMVEQNGGKLTAHSEGMGKGSTFTLQLPLYHISAEGENGLAGSRTMSSPSPPPRNPLSCSNSPLRILVVDDVESNRKLMSRMARNHHHLVDEAQDGREAVDMVRAAADQNCPYDTILMDYEMPVMNGPDAVLEIRKIGCNSFILGVTGNVLIEDVKHFTCCGANAVLPKPVRFQMLQDIWLEHGLLGDHPNPT